MTKTTDFTIWFKAHEEDFVSIHPESERAREWCAMNRVGEDFYRGMENDEARQLHEVLLAAGFNVLAGT